MDFNPVNDGKELMWHFFLEGNQKPHIPTLKKYVYDLIGMTTQKTAGQDAYKKKDHIDWKDLDMTLMNIAIEATALVLSGCLDEIERSTEDDES